MEPKVRIDVGEVYATKETMNLLNVIDGNIGYCGRNPLDKVANHISPTALLNVILKNILLRFGSYRYV